MPLQSAAQQRMQGQQERQAAATSALAHGAGSHAFSSLGESSRLRALHGACLGYLLVIAAAPSSWVWDYLSIKVAALSVALC